MIKGVSKVAVSYGRPPSESYVCVEYFNQSVILMQGCYVRGFYLEGARWDIEEGCLRRSHPKVLVTELPIMYIIPIEFHKLKLQVNANTISVVPNVPT